MICTLLVGCRTEIVELTEVLNYSSCKNLYVGAEWVEFEQLAKIRGVTMDTSLPAPEQMFLAISRGKQPTSGFALALNSFSAADHTLQLNLDWLQPDPDSVQVLATTSPCLVIAIDAPPAIKEVEVRVEEEVLARVRLPALAKN